MNETQKATLLAEFHHLQSECFRFSDAANAGTLTRADRDTYEANVARMEGITQKIERERSLDAVAGVTASVLGRSVTDRPLGSAGHGEELLIRGKATLGRVGNPKFRSAIDELETLQRAVQHGVSGDGISPVTIEGDLIKFVDANRYAVNASRRLPMPDNRSQTFKRPRLTQSTSVAEQVTQGDVLASQRITTTGDVITKRTFGGVLSLSEQEIDWTDPAMLGLAIQDLAEQYAIVTDDVLCTAIETAFTASTQTVCSLTAASDVFLAAVAKSAAATYGTAKRVPDVFYAAPDRWAYMIGLTDGDGRPLFPVSSAQNAPGTVGGVSSFDGGFNLLGMRVVVDPNFTTGVWGTAVSSLVESYEQNKGLLTINAPSTLEVQYAYRGYFATNVYTNGVNAIETA